VHQQAEKEESAHKSAVATSALSKLKEKQLQEEKQLKAKIAADENQRMKELREGEEYARKVDQAELDRANQEVLA
jgi:intein/homing endonuclease